MNDKPLGLGVIGAGRITQAAHLPAIAAAAGVQLTGICDASPALVSGVSRRWQVPGYTDASALLADPHTEAVVVAVPDRFHLQVAMQALGAGRHVLVEKPLAGSVDEARHLAADATERGLVVQVGAMKRHDPGIEYAAEAMASIGEVLSATVWYRVMSDLRPGTEATLFPPLIVDEQVRSVEATFKADRQAYLLATHGSHVFDGLRYLLGDLTAVSARSARHDRDLTWHGTGTLPSGGLVHFEITANVHGEWSEGADVFGSKGTVRIRSHFPFFRRASDVEVYHEASGAYTRPTFADTNAYERQVEAFAAAVRKTQPPNPTADDGVEAVRYIEAVGQSAALDGQTVQL